MKTTAKDLMTMMEDIMDEGFKKKAVESIRSKEEARQIAVDWQNWQSNKNLSYQEVSEWGDYFEKVAKKFGLTKEFKENGVI